MHPISEKAKLAMLAMQRFSWEQGTAMQALLECGDLEAMAMMAEEAAYRSLEDGRVAMMGNETAVNDPCACGEGLIIASRMPGHEHLAGQRKNCCAGRWSLRPAAKAASSIIWGMACSSGTTPCICFPPSCARRASMTKPFISFTG